MDGHEARVTAAAFEPEPTAVAAARRFVQETLNSWQLSGHDELVADAVLLTSELVTNALVHAGTSIQLTCRLDDAAVEVINPRVQAIRAYVEEQAVTELPHDYLVAMPIAGWLERIDLREGDPVSKEQVVARLDREDLADRVHQAEQRIAVLQTRIAETEEAETSFG